MDRAIKHYFNKDIKEKIKLLNGWKETWLLILSDNQKLVFRACDDHANIFEREKFFYESVNKELGSICPKVYVVDGTCEYYAKTFQISEYIDGQNLGVCMKEFDEQKKREIYYKIGEITALINNIEINKNHPYIKSRISWEDYFSHKLYNQLFRIIKNNFISTDEINKICENMRSKKATHTLSFTHLDIRPHNIIYNNGDIFVIDAEECEFGDPLCELAFIELEWSFWEMHDTLLKGYKSVMDIDLNNELYFYYKLERLGLILDMHYNHNCKNEWSEFFLNIFNKTKKRVLDSFHN